jgi:hypothetical protein
MLRRQAARDRVSSRGKHDEEAVSFGAHLMPTELAKNGTLNRALGRQGFAVPVAETAQQRRRALDVAEQHRDRPSWKPPHAPDYQATPADSGQQYAPGRQRGWCTGTTRPAETRRGPTTPIARTPTHRCAAPVWMLGGHLSLWHSVEGA